LGGFPEPGKVEAVRAGRQKIALVSSVGGHLSELLQLRGDYGAYEHFYVLNEAVPWAGDIGAPSYVIAHAERDWRVLWNLWEVWRIFHRERPTAVISLGAGPAVPAFAVAGMMGIPRLFIETFAAVERPSLTGRLIYRLGLYEHFCYQWPALRTFYRRGICTGWIYDLGIPR
jgi:beta-1,4-N-acetylglucosaminyltransferase